MADAEMEDVPNPRYYRRVVLTADFFHQWLNLPDGFVVERIKESDIEYGPGLALLIRCPEREEFKVKEGEYVPLIQGIIHVNEAGVVDAISWPELGQLR